MAIRKKPQLCRRHKQSGQAIVTLVDAETRRYRDVRPGKYGSSETRQEYSRAIVEWEAAGRRLVVEEPESAPDMTVHELLAHFLRHAETHYRHPNGEPTGDVTNYKYAMKAVKECFDSRARTRRAARPTCKT